MDEQAFELLMQRFDSIEEKVDDLVKFKYWFIGAGAAVSCFVSFAVTIFLQ